SGRIAARGLAGAGALRTHDRGDSEPARGVDPHRQDPVRSWPALFALADHSVVATGLVRADRMGRGAVFAPGRRRLVPAFWDGLGTPWCRAVAAGCRRAHRGGHQAGLSRNPRQARTHAADPGIAAGTGAVVIGSTMIRRVGKGACAVPTIVIGARKRWARLPL